MVRTASTMTPLRSKAPEFELPDPRGGTVSLSDFDGEPLLVMFICNHCPFVKHIADELAAFCAEFEQKGLASVAINANDARSHPDDAPEAMVEEAEARGYTFPYLFDESQEVAKAYGAACTPDFFLFDADHRLAYRGQFDDSRPSNGQPVTGSDLRAAADAVLAGDPVPSPQVPSMGCNIKWKPGNAPEYFGI